MHRCMQTYMHVCVQICVQTSMYACISACTTCKYVCRYVCMCAQNASIHACMHACKHLCIHVCVFVCVCMYLYVCVHVHVGAFACGHTCTMPAAMLLCSGVHLFPHKEACGDISKQQMGVEPGTCRTQSEKHTTKPNGRGIVLALNISWDGRKLLVFFHDLYKNK